MGNNIVYRSKRGTWAPHIENSLVTGLKSCKKLLILLPKFFFFICKMIFTGGIDGKKIIKE